MTVAQKTFISVVLLASIASLQFLYEANKVASGEAPLPSPITPETVRLLDMGFHSTVASFLWVSTMPEVLDLFNKKTDYITDFTYLTTVDPKLSYPYAFSVITLPVVPHAVFPYAFSDAMFIGQEGLKNADPDWRIPYYMATNYYVDLKDTKSALEYFNIAAQTPGVPLFAKRFAENFGAGTQERERTRELWMSIRDSSNDPDTKAQAQAYIDRLNIFDYIEAAAAQYKKTYGAFPANINDLVTKKIIPAVPQDPFGFTFILNKDGTAGVNLDGQ